MDAANITRQHSDACGSPSYHCTWSMQSVRASYLFLQNSKSRCCALGALSLVSSLRSCCIYPQVSSDTLLSMLFRDFSLPFVSNKLKRTWKRGMRKLVRVGACKGLQFKVSISLRTLGRKACLGVGFRVPTWLLCALQLQQVVEGLLILLKGVCRLR